MNFPTRHPTNELISAVTHLFGFAFAIVGLVLLVQRAVAVGDGWSVVSVSIFGATLVGIYGMSTLYHAWPIQHRRKAVLRRWDYAMVYLVIAGTYTPIALVALRGSLGWSVFSVVWILALAGALMRLNNWHVHRSVGNLSYLILGWLVLLVMTPLIEAVSWSGFYWLFVGGVLYSTGLIFFGLETLVRPRQWFGMHEVFHLFVMAGSACHWWFIYRYIVQL